MTKNITSEEVRKIVKEELEKNEKSGKPKIPTHRHDGVDNLKVNQKDIEPNLRANGSITFSRSTIYTINISSNATSISFNGTAFNASDSFSATVVAFVVGNCQLGKSYQFQPGTSSSVIPGPIQNLIQCSSSVSVNKAVLTSSRADVSQGHLVYVTLAGSIVAMATVTSFSNTSIQITTSLASGWNIVGNYIVS